NAPDAKGKTLIEHAFADKNESLYALLLNNGAGIDKLLSETKKQTGEELLRIIKAEKFFDYHLRGFDNFLTRELSLSEEKFHALISQYDNEVMHLDAEKKRQYTHLLLNAFWECKGIPAHLKAIVGSPFFDLHVFKPDSKLIIFTVIDDYLENKKDELFTALLAHPKIHEVINIKDSYGHYPANKLTGDLKALQLMTAKGAKNNCTYDYIRKLEDKEIINTLLSSHDNQNAILISAIENKDHHLALQLYGMNPDLPSFQGVDIEEMHIKVSKELCNHYGSKNDPKSLEKQWIEKDEKQFQTFINEYEKNLAYLDENEKNHYGEILANVYFYFAKQYSEFHLKILAQSPFFQIKKVFGPLLQLYEKDKEIDLHSVFPLIEHKSFPDVMNERLSDKRLPTSLLASFSAPLLMRAIEKGAKLNYSYRYLNEVFARNFTSFQPVIKAHMDIERIIKDAIEDVNYPFLKEIQQLFDADLTKHVNFAEMKHFHAVKTAKAFCADYVTENNQVRFNPEVLQKNKEDFKAYLNDYEKHLALLADKDTEIYAELLKNAYLYFFDTQCVDHIDSLVSSPHFRLEKVMQPAIEMGALVKYKLHRAYVVGLLEHKDINALINKPFTDDRLPADYLKYDTTTLLAYVKKGAKHNLNYGHLTHAENIHLLPDLIPSH
ncbi:MAG TPA: hypothetical protein VHM20_07380, partial [Gammaproteobacteria bacterium]|nr:hypothetical protein [Gammaproteobacteria bacterium]